MKRKLVIWFVLSFLLITIQEGFFPKNAAVSTEIQKITASTTFLSATTAETTTLAVVTRIVDGDTIVVLIDGTSQKVRLIGIDTPETVDPRRAVECYGKEASDYTKSLLENKTVRLENDPTQDNRDKYGRLLRYVFLTTNTTDGALVNEKIITGGYGHEYTYRVPYKYQGSFKKAEALAREQQKGLWAKGVCST